MKIRSQRPGGQLIAWIAALALFAAACTASTTVAQSATIQDPPSESTESTESSASDDTSTATEPADDEDDAPDDADGSDDSTTAERTEPPAAESTEAPDDEPGDDSSADDATANDRELEVGEAGVVLIDPGAEPRTQLRMAIAATCTEIATITTVQEVSQTIGGQAMPETGPLGNVMEMATSATPVGDNYEIRAEVISATSTPDTPPLLAANIDAELEALVGLTSYATLTDRAVQVPGSSRVEGAEALGPLAGAVESLNQSQSPLPEEAVGVGAVWETTSVVEVEGIVLSTIATHEVVSIDGTIIELTVTGRQEVEPGSRMVTQGVSGDVVQWDVTSSGTTILDLATINPISATVITEGVQAFDFGAGGDLEQELFTQLETTSQPDDGCTGRTIRG